MQEYEVWEKVYTSDEGALNDFDRENYLQFFPSYFRSSVDKVGTATGALQWDFVGDYQVYDTENDETAKTLTAIYVTVITKRMQVPVRVYCVQNIGHVTAVAAGQSQNGFILVRESVAGKLLSPPLYIPRVSGVGGPP